MSNPTLPTIDPAVINITAPEFDVFLSYSSEDRPWCEKLAERLRNEGVRIWFDIWRLQPGHNLDVEINKAIESSRKMVAVWSQNYFRKTWTQVEVFSQQHGDPLSQDRPIIPVCIDNRSRLKIPPTLKPILSLDFANDADYELRFRELIEALDLPTRGLAEQLDSDLTEDVRSPYNDQRRSPFRGKRFESDVTALYRVLGFEVIPDAEVGEFQTVLQIRKRDGGLSMQAIVECMDGRIGAKERDQLVAKQTVAQRVFPKHRWIAVTSQGFTASARAALEQSGFDCITYAELLSELVPLSNYVDHLIADYDDWVNDPQNWAGRDLFIRPDIEMDITYERQPALAHLGKWLGDSRGNLLVMLGDLGTGKTTIARFLAHQMALSFRDDPMRHPAPVLIPLREVRKEVALDSIIVKHFRDRGLAGLSFPRFEHLARQGKIILFFDAFDEMADRIRWETTQANFQELCRAAVGAAKVVLTCRTHYFKDRTEQARLIGQGPSLSAAETALYRDLRQQAGAEVIYLQEFNDEQIRDYLTRIDGEKANENWQTIRAIYNLHDLAHRPLLLEMIVKSLPKLYELGTINAASLYAVYTNLWVERDFLKGRVTLDRNVKLALMTELAGMMWRDEKRSFSTDELIQFVTKLHTSKSIAFGNEEVEDIVSEVQAASFLRRDRDSADFSFMHKSFFEFFLATKILSTLTESGFRTVTSLETRRIDQKIIYFLTLLDKPDALRGGLRQILTSQYKRDVSENALHVLYWGGRIRCGMEEQIRDLEKLQHELSVRLPAGMRLGGAQLPAITLEGASLVKAELSGADLTGANLNDTRLSECDCQKAKIDKAKAERLVCEHTSFREASITETIITGAQFENCDLSDAHYDVSRFTIAGIQSVPYSGIARKNVRDNLRPVVQLGASAPIHSVGWNNHARAIADGTSDGALRIYRDSDRQVQWLTDSSKGSIWCLDFDQNGDFVATGNEDGTVRIWNTANGRLAHTLLGHTASVRSIAVSPRDSSIASGSADSTINLWAAESGQLVRTIREHRSVVLSMAFDHLGARLASGDEDWAVRLWNPQNGELIFTREEHSGPVLSVAFDPQSVTLASGSMDGRIKLWDASTGKLRGTLSAGPGGIRSVAFNLSGELLASGSWDHAVTLWAAGSGNPVWTHTGHSGPVRSVRFSPDGRCLVAGGEAGRLEFVDIMDGKTFLTFYPFSPGVWLALLPDGRFDGTREALRYLSYTQDGALRAFTAEEVLPDFHDPEAIRQALAEYNLFSIGDADE